MIKNERSVTTEYYDAVKELIGTSACVGCPVMQDQFLTPALRLDHVINWANTSYAANLPSMALRSVIAPEELADHNRHEKREITEDFTRFFGQTPKKFVENIEPPLTVDSIDQVASALVQELPKKNKEAGDQLVKELEEKLGSCSNTKKKPAKCAA